ncbi:MAG: site-2 protease family protein, partial [Ignavibacteriaceae bacterium]
PMFFISITIHEFAHAYIASKLGDNTAKKLGRLTLNPFKHADLIGTVIMPIASFTSGIALIGWAKPVPIDRSNFKNHLRDDAVVSFAGPLSNFILSLIFFLAYIVTLNLSFSGQQYVENIFWYGVFFNIFLFLFNLLPFPPLDGSHILYDIFPNNFTAKILNLGFYGTIILLLFIYSPLWGFFTDLINFVLGLFIKVERVING